MMILAWRGVRATSDDLSMTKKLSSSSSIWSSRIVMVTHCVRVEFSGEKKRTSWMSR